MTGSLVICRDAIFVVRQLHEKLEQRIRKFILVLWI